jgi:hypothetical protein
MIVAVNMNWTLTFFLAHVSKSASIRGANQLSDQIGWMFSLFSFFKIDNETKVVGGELINRKKTQNEVRSDKDIVEIKWSRKHRVTYWGDRQSGTISDNDDG